MNDEHVLASIFKPLHFAALGLLIAGCSGPSRGGSQPKPGSGIAEYRQITREAQQAVAATVDSLEGLARSNTKSSTNRPALDKFDRAVHQLELTSAKTRARAEAIIARGQAYFDEWKQQLGAVTNQAARADAERYTRLLGHFERIRERSGDVRTEFRPFMAKLREFRAAFDRSPAGGASPGSAIDDLTGRGRRVLDTLASVSRALDDAEVELRAMLASKR